MSARLAVLVLVLPLLGGCAGVASTVRGWSNEDLLGRPAPALEGSEWILPQGFELEELDGAHWRLVALFRPG